MTSEIPLPERLALETTMLSIPGWGLSGVATVDGVMPLGEKATSAQLGTRGWHTL